jgi:repressor LexA
MITTQRVYDFILWAVLETGLPPSIRQIMSGVGLRSSNTVWLHIRRLEKMGLVTMVNRHPLPVAILEYIKLFEPPTQIQVMESAKK